MLLLILKNCFKSFCKSAINNRYNQNTHKKRIFKKTINECFINGNTIINYTYIFKYYSCCFKLFFIFFKVNNNNKYII